MVRMHMEAAKTGGHYLNSADVCVCVCVCVCERECKKTPQRGEGGAKVQLKLVRED